MTFASCSTNRSVIRARSPRSPDIVNGNPTTTSSIPFLATNSESDESPSLRERTSKKPAPSAIRSLGSEIARPMRRSPRSTPRICMRGVYIAQGMIESGRFRATTRAETSG